MPNSFMQRYAKIERISFGQPIADAVVAELASCGAQRVLLLCNSSTQREGRFLDSIRGALGSRCVGEMTSLRAHSPSDDVLAAATLARETKADLILAAGGGSVMDTTKVVAICLIDGLHSLDELKQLPAYAKVDQSRWPAHAGADAIRFVLVPTTLSSAEFNWGASFNDEAGGKKYAVGHPLMAPQAVLLDPQATMLVPTEMFLGTGMKAIDHAVERLASSFANPFSDATSSEALALLDRSLRRIKEKEDDLPGRLDAQTASWLSTAGQTSGVPIGLSHPLGRNLSVHANVDHGKTTGIILPAVLRWNAPANAERQKRIAAILGRAGDAAADAIADLAATLGLPRRLRDIGVSRDVLPEVARKTFGEGGVRTNPRPVRSEADILEVLEAAY